MVWFQDGNEVTLIVTLIDLKRQETFSRTLTYYENHLMHHGTATLKLCAQYITDLVLPLIGIGHQHPRHLLVAVVNK